MSPVDTVRSRFETFRGWGLDWSEFSLKSGWDTVESFGRRVCAIAVLTIGCAMVNPIWLPSQTPMQYEMRADLKAASQRLDSIEAKLAKVPEDVAVLKEQTARNTEALESMNTRSWGLIAMLIAWACRSLFLDLGGKERKTTR